MWKTLILFQFMHVSCNFELFSFSLKLSLSPISPINLLQVLKALTNPLASLPRRPDMSCFAPANFDPDLASRLFSGLCSVADNLLLVEGTAYDEERVSALGVCFKNLMVFCRSFLQVHSAKSGHERLSVRLQRQIVQLVARWDGSYFPIISVSFVAV